MLVPASLFLVAASAAIDVPVVDGVDLVQSVERYTVSAITAPAMFEEMQALGVHDPETGRRNLGYTRGDAKFSYDFTGAADGKCTLENIQVRLDVRITLPQWQPSGKPGSRLEAQWRAFSAALTGHEVQHRDILVNGAKAIRDALDEMPALPCGEVEARVNSMIGPMMDETTEAGRAYDARTEHGRTEGAWWLIR